MRFTRFFNNTPMAIASVDGQGRILRTNAPFLKLFSNVVSRDDIERGATLETIFSEGERPKLAQAFAAAKDRQGDIPSIDSRNPNDETRHLVKTFAETWKMGFAAMLGLIGGKALP